ncbi:hypothetical protein MG293_000720 [Ovis ammon polii]|uniref:Uncharacterized protein n=1 Tax=Ovis ammon polii TaxID=230172 RepID=A0AAD4UQU9_OVIAM|nr:hypothetical protein MG293_000720 [Ovis ammon polii]
MTVANSENCRLEQTLRVGVKSVPASGERLGRMQKATESWSGNDSLISKCRNFRCRGIRQKTLSNIDGNTSEGFWRRLRRKMDVGFGGINPTLGSRPGSANCLSCDLGVSTICNLPLMIASQGLIYFNERESDSVFSIILESYSGETRMVPFDHSVRFVLHTDGQLTGELYRKQQQVCRVASSTLNFMPYPFGAKPG